MNSAFLSRVLSILACPLGSVRSSDARMYFDSVQVAQSPVGFLAGCSGLNLSGVLPSFFWRQGPGRDVLLIADLTRALM